MNGTAAGLHRASVEAAGFVLDVPLIGVEEAAARALRHWQDGARLRELPCGSWLLQLAEPVVGRADRGPGLPLLSRSGALAALGVPDGAGAAGEVLVLRGGAPERHRLVDLPLLDPARWLALDVLTVRHLRPLEAEPVPAPVLEAVPEPPRPDLRAAAGVRPASARVRRVQESGPRSGGPGAAGWGALPLASFVVALLGLAWPAAVVAGTAAVPVGAAVGGAALVGTVLAGRSLLRARPFRTAAAGEGVGAGTGTGGRGSGVGGTGHRRHRRLRRVREALSGRLAVLALRTPAARVVHGRQARYLHELTTAFRRRRWDDALRDALALAGPEGERSGSWLTLGLPKRRTGALRPALHGGSVGATSALSGPTVHQHLSGLYREAVGALEHEGRIDEAAFVLADLLADPAAAVALLERHQRYRGAAELAEGRGLDAGLTVRLWWRAGERDRAVRLAERHRVFAATVQRLAAVDRDAARGLREAWVRSCRAAGDRMGAVEAAWPDERLRPLVAADLRDGVALGGTVRARSLAYLLALGAGEACAPTARTLLAGDEPELLDQRRELALSLARVPGSDPALDRELTTAAARAAVRDGGFGPHLDGRTGRDLFRTLLERADPLAAADLRPPRTGPAPAGTVGELHADPLPGRVRLSDAVALESGAVLVACGQAGVRLLTPGGRTKARWDVPADRLVVADHGGVALLVARYGHTVEIARLDLATRTVRPWTTLRDADPLPSFDGRLLTVVEDRALTVYDTLAARPTVVWRELGAGSDLLLPPARTPDSLGAVVATPPLVERWRWDLPGGELRSRLALDDLPGSAAVLAEGSFLHLEPSPDGLQLVRRGEQGTARRPVHHLTDPVLLTDGDLHAVAGTRPGGTVLELGLGPVLRTRAVLHFPSATPADLALRHHGTTATVRHHDGRLLALTADGSRLLANLRLTAD